MERWAPTWTPVTAVKGADDAVVDENQVTTSAELADVLVGSGDDGSRTYLSPMTAYNLYVRASALYIAVDRIARAASGLDLGITRDGTDFTPKSDALEVLRSPSATFSKRHLLYHMMSSYLITNESPLVLRGRVDRPPVGRTFIYPFDISVNEIDSTGMPKSLLVTAEQDRRTYHREEKGGFVRWIDERRMNELCLILGNRSPFVTYRGHSPLVALLYDLDQSLAGKRHNSSLLHNGLRANLILAPMQGETLDKTARNQVTQGIKAQSGSHRAGTTLVVSRPLQSIVGRASMMNNQEMEYVQLLNSATHEVYNYYGVPLPLVTNDAATFNNYGTAQMSFYDQAVFPPFDDLAQAITDALAPRFEELQGRHITYNESTIRALATRNIERMGKMRTAQAFRTDEIRAVGGAGAVPGGDTVLVNAGLVPLDAPVPDVPEGGDIGQL